MLAKIKSALIDKLYHLYSSFNRRYEDELKRACQDSFSNVGDNFRVSLPISYKNLHYVEVGDNFYCGDNLRIEAWDRYNSQEFSPRIIIGNNVNIQQFCHIGCIDSVIIEDNVLIASRVYISDHFHGNISSEDSNVAPAKRPLSSKGPVRICQNVWIGAGVSIMPGVTIGENAIIGSNAVVTSDIPPNCVAAGVPAKVLKTF